jgi:hypothetical protein
MSKHLPIPPTTGFVEACNQLLANRPFLEQQDYGALLGDRRMKWHQTDDKNATLKALSFFHRKDGALVGICKKGWVTVSTDDGDTWSQPVIPPSLVTGTGKVWGQRTPDGRYALGYNPDHKNRFPLVMVTSDDGVTFRGMRVMHGELPLQRYVGLDKNVGPQYVRGISEWSSDGSWKDDAMWVAYSVNKEDIWVSRIPLTNSSIEAWNTYSPKWAPVTILKDGVNLEDRDPYDYARVIRLFPAKAKVTASFILLITKVGDTRSVFHFSAPPPAGPDSRGECRRRPSTAGNLPVASRPTHTPIGIRFFLATARSPKAVALAPPLSLSSASPSAPARHVRSSTAQPNRLRTMYRPSPRVTPSNA